MKKNNFKFEHKKHSELFSIGDFSKSFNFVFERKRYNTFACFILLAFPNILLANKII